MLPTLHVLSHEFEKNHHNSNFGKSLHTTHLLELVDKVDKYEMDMYYERYRMDAILCTDGQIDGQDKNKYRKGGGAIININSKLGYLDSSSLIAKGL